jgi:2-desacetyl-2-hydroxyethyl bacteriochlorophyllide A dehydrogenase
MRAAVLNDDHTFDVGDVADPTPGERELVLQVRACGICGSDLKSHTMMPPGSVLGHEFCGDVVAVGSAARDRWREGQLVAALPVVACGRCRWCHADEPVHCERVDLLGVGGSAGGFAEYVRVDADQSVALDEAVGDHGAIVEPLAVGLHTVEAARIRPGDRVLVIGGGNVGAAVAFWTRRLGAAEVVISDPVASRRDAAGLWGATDVHDPADGPPRPGFDVVIECVGAPGLIQAAIDATAVHGRVVIAGVCTAPDAVVPLTAIMKEVDVRFAVYYRGREFAAAAAVLGSGAFAADAFVTSSVGLDDVGDAFTRLLAGGDDRKVLVRPALSPRR